MWTKKLSVGFLLLSACSSTKVATPPDYLVQTAMAEIVASSVKPTDLPTSTEIACNEINQKIWLSKISPPIFDMAEDIGRVLDALKSSDFGYLEDAKANSEYWLQLAAEISPPACLSDAHQLAVDAFSLYNGGLTRILGGSLDGIEDLRRSLEKQIQWVEMLAQRGFHEFPTN